ncbi:MAG: aminopeptidase P N-terminal domain-containing protein [Acidobacteria bacterium]|nr:aminopeptidase P N-terminal domain-containing protein [Acidobacteriota bacterium]
MPLSRVLAAFFLATFLCTGQSAPWFQKDFPPEEFQARWAKLYDKIGNNAVAFVQGVPLTAGFIMPRQSNEFYYLCGIETPHSYLLLDGRTRKSTLFLPPRNARLEASEGRVLSSEDVEQVKKITGADTVADLDALRGNFMNIPSQRGQQPITIYSLFSPAEGTSQSRYEINAANMAILNDFWDSRIPREQQFTSMLMTRFPRMKFADLTPILDELRSVKSPREVSLIKRASEIAGQGILEAMKSTKAGMYEYELDAAARYVFLVNGARLEGYRSITAAGTANIWNAHYYRNMSRLDSGQLVLMDFAPDYKYYTSDVTRMWPVNGKYTPVQRELLQFVLEYRNAIIKRIRPGVTAKQIMAEAKVAMEPVFAKTKFSKPAYEGAARELVERGGGVFSHPVGLAVHDDGPYSGGPLKPGHVFSIDPQLRVPDENLYIRYEDVVAVTETGVENFTDWLVSELDDMEKVVKTGGGMVTKFPSGPPPAAK